jgi:hypothetical protein
MKKLLSRLLLCFCFSSTAQSIPQVGDLNYGGVVFYIDSITQTCFVALPTSESHGPYTTLYCVEPFNGAYDTSIGAGENNTISFLEYAHWTNSFCSSECAYPETLEFYINHGMNNDINSLGYNLYENQETAEAMRIKIAALLHQKDYQTSQSLVYEYAQVYTDNYADFKQIELDLIQDQLNWFQMSAGQIETLQQIANQTEMYGAKNAQVILDLINDTQLTEYILPIAEPIEMRQALSYDYTTVNRNLLSLSPNPTNGEVYASYELPESYQQAQLEIYNAMGQKVDVLDVSLSKYLSRINCEQYPSGIYLISLVLDGMNIESQTLSVITK